MQRRQNYGPTGGDRGSNGFQSFDVAKLAPFGIGQPVGEKIKKPPQVPGLPFSALHGSGFVNG
jgi:hypothetical protein